MVIEVNEGDTKRALESGYIQACFGKIAVLENKYIDMLVQNGDLGENVLEDLVRAKHESFGPASDANTCAGRGKDR